MTVLISPGSAPSDGRSANGSSVEATISPAYSGGESRRALLNVHPSARAAATAKARSRPPSNGNRVTVDVTESAQIPLDGSAGSALPSRSHGRNASLIGSIGLRLAGTNMVARSAACRTLPVAGQTNRQEGLRPVNPSRYRDPPEVGRRLARVAILQ
jgi:hypothetical protein